MDAGEIQVVEALNDMVGNGDITITISLGR